ncbi:MAG: cytochrome c [Burkholderiales bacterium]|nr:cytochrome c [Burkholderiales bacterium]
MRRLLTVLTAFALAGVAAAADIAAGEAKAKEVCAACHQADGNSTDPNNPRLAGQHRSYLAKALRDYKSGERNNPIMGGFAKALSKADIENLAAYFASRPSSLGVKY